MRILFVHQNFPAQYMHIAKHLVQEGCHDIRAIAQDHVPDLPGISISRYKMPSEKAFKAHPWAQSFNYNSHCGEYAMREAMRLRDIEGFYPEVICSHSGWGEYLYLKGVWPDAKLILYSEFYFKPNGADVGFDPEFRPMNYEASYANVVGRNAALAMGLEACTKAVAPTPWQRSVHPQCYIDKIHAIHDGIDTQISKPAEKFFQMKMENGALLKLGDEIITYVARHLEPYRGYHIFMRALPEILRQRPNAHVIIEGAEGVSYGKAAPEGQSWKNIYLNEVKDKLDMQRVHFLGKQDYNVHCAVLQLSAVHIYLTYPFVLSWSFTEALSTGCLVVGSDTGPVREVIKDGYNGMLVPFFDTEALTRKVVKVLAMPERYKELRANARKTIVENFDLKTVCLPKQLELIRAVAEGREPDFEQALQKGLITQAA